MLILIQWQAWQGGTLLVPCFTETCQQCSFLATGDQPQSIPKSRYWFRSATALRESTAGKRFWANTSGRCPACRTPPLRNKANAISYDNQARSHELFYCSSREAVITQWPRDSNGSDLCKHAWPYLAATLQNLAAASVNTAKKKTANALYKQESMPCNRGRISDRVWQHLRSVF